MTNPNNTIPTNDTENAAIAAVVPVYTNKVYVASGELVRVTFANVTLDGAPTACISAVVMGPETAMQTAQMMMQAAHACAGVRGQLHDQYAAGTAQPGVGVGTPGGPSH